jgi:hypothetical protein
LVLAALHRFDEVKFDGINRRKKMATTDDTVTSFFSTIANFPGTTDGPTTVHNLINNVFCPNDDPNNPTMPGVGITSHGPNFLGATEVARLFTQLFTSFPDISFTELTKKRRMDSRNNAPTPMIGTPTFLMGTYTAPWFAKVPGQHDSISHYSKALSDIPIFANNYLPTRKIAGFALFYFGSTTSPLLISQLAIYLDRYSFIRDLYQVSDSTTPGFASIWHGHDKPDE